MNSAEKNVAIARVVEKLRNASSLLSISDTLRSRDELGRADQVRQAAIALMDDALVDLRSIDDPLACGHKALLGVRPAIVEARVAQTVRADR